MEIDLLKKWLKTYLKSKDAPIVHIEEGEGTLFVEYTGKKHLYLIQPDIKNIAPILEQLKSKEHPATLVLLNTEKNLVQLIAWWDELAQYPHLSIFFVLPATNEKWAIVPFTHDKISERKHLEKGLRALAEGIGYVQ